MNALLLVVEDEPVLRISLVRGLTKLQGVTAVGAGTIAEALEIIENEPPQLIVSDIDLPDGSGLELISVLDQRSLKIPIIYASAYVAKYRVQIPSRSNITVLEKPIPLAEIRKMVTDRLSVASSEEAKAAPFDATDYLQLACMCRKSVDIVVHQEAEELGHILIRDGELWGAVKGQSQGEEALRDLVFATGVEVSCVGIRRPETERTIHQSWESILLEAARLHDEGEASPKGPFDDDGTVTFEFDRVEEEQPKTAPPPAPPANTTESRPTVVFDYEKRERRLREYEESQYPARNVDTQSQTAPAASNYVKVRFDELYEEGVDALLARDYPRALEAFKECNSLVPTDSRVIANLKRLTDMGYATGEDS